MQCDRSNVSFDTSPLHCNNASSDEADLLHFASSPQVDQRLRAEAAWENTSRFKAQSVANQSSAPQATNDADDALDQRRRALADKLAVEEAQLRELVAQPETVKLAARRQEMLELARRHAAARDGLRLQVCCDICSHAADG